MYLKVIDNIAQVNTRGSDDDCSYHATSTLEVTMSEELDGAMFMCSILEADQSDSSKPAYYDEVQLQLKGELKSILLTVLSFSLNIIGLVVVAAVVTVVLFNQILSSVYSLPSLSSCSLHLMCFLLSFFHMFHHLSRPFFLLWSPFFFFSVPGVVI